jgi:glycyl-tRNA synthetase
MKKLNNEELATFAKKKGFVFQSAEIYGGLAGFFDFGPLGVQLKNNLKNLFLNNFVLKREDVVVQDGSIITNPKVWKASGHIDNFADLILTTKISKTKLRADHFIEDNLKIPADGMDAKDINDLIKKHNLKYKGEDFGEVKDFNLMFSTNIGADVNKTSLSYLRPETCQSIFPNFKIILETSRLALPFGIAQIGKAFRNEISPRDFLFRLREFEQIEMEYFFNPDSEFDLLEDRHLNCKFKFLSANSQDNNSDKMEEVSISDLIEKNLISKIHGYWLAEFFLFFMEKSGLSYENMRIREHVKKELSHYSRATFDIDYKYSFGYKEMLGLANRGNYDLLQHQNLSKSKFEVFDEKAKTKVLPHIIEPSFGIERWFMAVLNEAYNDDEERGNIVLNFDLKLSPFKVAVFPLMNKEELVGPAREIYNRLINEEITCVYDKSGSVGKRYARQDEIGTPFCITIDYETIENGDNKNTVTIRNRDTTKQKRVAIERIVDIINDLIKGRIKFEEIK